ncbi:phosphotransferase [Microbacterium sp. W1N]|uniref:phosphotransferase family protein n=1 Tax=Microbacterium festucae TaxID=2977531 RepID=UPI0021C0B583|nr:phosphotransferase [Microbacterium festucae]MCT9821496.1 phosphotransferase [Microbacterium festucae]
MSGRLVVDDDVLREIVAPLGEVDAFEALGGGMFATAHRVRFRDGRRAVVKIVGADTSRMATYEHGILRTEAEVYRMLAGSGVPVPEVLLTDFTRARVDGDVVVAAHLDGVVWESLRLPDDESAGLRRALGALMADAHRVVAPRFGYPASPALQGPSWRAAYAAMLAAILADGERWGVPLPAAAIRSAVAAHHAALDTVADPVVVHADLWPGNVFVDTAARRITGVIDTERTVWGDPLLDLAGAEQFSAAAPDADILAGDRAAGGELAALLETPAGVARLHLCRLYYATLLVVECTIRGYDGEFGQWCEATARTNLALALERLGAAAASGSVTATGS